MQYSAKEEKSLGLSHQETISSWRQTKDGKTSQDYLTVKTLLKCIEFQVKYIHNIKWILLKNKILIWASPNLLREFINKF